ADFLSLHLPALPVGKWSCPELAPAWPNVCLEQELAIVGHRQPCVQAFTRTLKVWKQDCGGRRWCVGYERRYVAGCNKQLVLLSCSCSSPGLPFSSLPDVNECKVGNGGCESQCCNTIGSFYCKCAAGWRLAQDGRACADVDECQVHNGGCQHRCVNTLGSYYCECKPGFRLHTDGRTCIAVNSCALNNGGCEHDCVQVTLAQHRCQCRHNYQLRADGKRCALRNPCGERNGGCMHQCHSHGGTARCQCHPGYRLAPDGKACQDVNECLTGQARCAHQCLNTRGSFKCTCNPGYELGADSKQCYRIEMEIVNSCEANNGGCSHTCHHTSSGPVCTCNFGYRLEEDRKTCTDINECDGGSHCCQQDCYNYPGGYECACYAGYRLSTDGCGCDDVDECSASNAGCEHTCQNQPGSFQCGCEIGYKLEEDRRSCSSIEGPVEALDGQRPVIRPIPHVAILRDEFTQLFSDDYEEEEEEMEARGEHTLSEKFVCLEHTFGPDCSLTCDDCQNGATCDAEESGCDCPAGWAGLLCNQSEWCRCFEFGMVFLSSAGNETTGRNWLVFPENLSLLPGCPKGFFGKQCRKKCNCANRGRCHRIYGACLCDPGLYGRFCHLVCPKWAFGPGCSEECRCVQQNTQDCDKRDGSCRCKPGYRGKRCETRELPRKWGCPFPIASHRGTCCKPCCCGFHPSLFDAECPEGTFGAGCRQPCSCGGAPCDRSTGQCLCLPGWTGRDCACPEGRWGQGCQEICPECANNASCDPATGACLCPPGYTGRRCQDACPPGWFGPDCQQSCSCGNEGHCHPATGTCRCAPGWTGPHCQRACDAGRWGPDCAHACNCSNSDGSCSAETGQCLCDPGYTGGRCERKCPEGWFGLSCQHRCQCDNGAACDHVSGACTCSPGWRGTFCEHGKYLRDPAPPAGLLHSGAEPLAGGCHAGQRVIGRTACPEGFYGLECREACNCLNGARCDHATGQCHCPPGWDGPRCGQPCPQGLFGARCGEHCDCGDNVTCHHVTGACDCPRGWRGRRCEKGETDPSEAPKSGKETNCLFNELQVTEKRFEELTASCLPGTFGAGCAHACQCAGATQECHPVTGACVCAPGFHGPSCQLGESVPRSSARHPPLQLLPTAALCPKSSVPGGAEPREQLEARELTGCRPGFPAVVAFGLVTVAEVFSHSVLNHCPALAARELSLSRPVVSCSLAQAWPCTQTRQKTRRPCTRNSAVALAD
uniref:Multiple EGF like domains 6 n=1 Tax=Athene cunicularia TaxID=194338 RepID=A0A663LWL9_ATHCN